MTRGIFGCGLYSVRSTSYVELKCFLSSHSSSILLMFFFFSSVYFVNNESLSYSTLNLDRIKGNLIISSASIPRNPNADVLHSATIHRPCLRVDPTSPCPLQPGDDNVRCQQLGSIQGLTRAWSKKELTFPFFPCVTFLVLLRYGPTATRRTELASQRPSDYPAFLLGVSHRSVKSLFTFVLY